MRNRVERLRIWLLGSAVFLMVVIAAYIGAARYVKHRFLAALPGKLGIDVRSDANGVTFSHSVRGRTIYTVHAAKKEEHTDGKIALHDVSIVLYGQDGSRRDRISGSDFEYDTKAGLLRAMGTVHIDLQDVKPPPEPAAEAPAGGMQVGMGELSGDKVLHVTTSGLVYMEKLGVAATSDYIEFQAGGITGHATGADYSSDSGMLMLHSAVSMSGVQGGQAVQFTASTASFDERSQEALLTLAKYSTIGRTAEAEQATLHRRPDGSLERVEAQGNVRIDANGGTIRAQRADVALNTKSQPQTAVLSSGVQYSLDGPLRQRRGQANAATITFDKQAKPQPEHAVFNGAVHMTERTRATGAAQEPWSVRDLAASRVDAVLASVGGGNAELRSAEAIGEAHLTLVNKGSLASSKGEGQTDLFADELSAVMTGAGNGTLPQLDTIAGSGHTVLRQVGVDGIEQMSSGDALDASFRSKTAVGKSAGGAAFGGLQGGEALASAMQQGHVAVMQRRPAKKGKDGKMMAADVEHAFAEKAVYDGDANRATLTGAVRVEDAGSVLWASQVVLDRTSGDSQAMGGVKADYVQAATQGAVQKSAEPTHILADRAELVHATNVATFYGKPVRLWQGGSQIQAPEVEMAREQKRLVARGGSSGGAQVHTVLVSAGSGGGAGTVRPAAATVTPCGTGKAGATLGTSTQGAASAVRIVSGGLTYSGNLRQADFTGGVRADTGDATIRASEATAYLHASAAGKDASDLAGVPSLAGSLERVIANGHIVLTQPGVQAAGERLLYTAADRVFLLTGERNAPPKATDAQGTTTGAALRFHDACDASGGVSVEALGEVPGEAPQRVVTDSRISNDKLKEKGRQ